MFKPTSELVDLIGGTATDSFNENWMAYLQTNSSSTSSVLSTLEREFLLEKLGIETSTDGLDSLWCQYFDDVSAGVATDHMMSRVSAWVLNGGALTLEDQVAAIVTAQGNTGWLRPTDFGTFTSPSEGATPTVVETNGVVSLRFNPAASQRMAANLTNASLDNAHVYVAVTSILANEAGMFFSNNALSNYAGWMFNGSTGSAFANAGTPTLEVDGVSVANRNELHDAVADGGVHLIKMSGVDFATWTELNLNNAGGDSAKLAMDIAGVLISQNLSSEDQTTIEEYYNTLLGLA